MLGFGSTVSFKSGKRLGKCEDQGWRKHASEHLFARIRIVKISTWRLLALCGLGMALSASRSSAEEELKVGDKAPDFSLPGSDGKTYKLSDFKGKKAVVIAWFPKADTPGCTAECKSFKETSETLKPLGVAYFTASVDKPEMNKKFAEKLDLDYPILSDPDKEVAKAYGVVHGTRQAAERWTFYIDKEGIVKKIDKKINTKDAGPDLAKAIKDLGI